MRNIIVSSVPQTRFLLNCNDYQYPNIYITIDSQQQLTQEKTNNLTSLSFFLIDADAAVVLDEATSTYQLEQYTKEELYNTHPHDVSAKWQFDKKQEVNSKN